MKLNNHMKTCEVSGNKIAYYREGKGETVLLVHGITTYSFIWRNMIPALASNFDVIAIDLLGCGDSDKPLDVSYSLKAHSSLLKEFIHKLGVRKFHFVGHDVGGGIGQIIAVNYPELLIDLSLINSVAYDFWPVQPIIAMRTPIIRQLAMATLDFGTFKLIIRRAIFHKERLTTELMNHFWRPMKTKAGRKAFLHFARCLDNRNLMEIVDRLAKVEIPVLIIRGDADIYLSSSISEKLHNEIPRSRLIRIETGGHMIQEDEPDEVVQHLCVFFHEDRHATNP